ncbi:replication protein P [Gammaproteobacteria bacterium]|uniref:Replicative helicase inhibitor G39P N-terminal domain-containing protein n=1 Tax=OM182 bacterium MED-G28 TaxID=1986256 RepID=A0A2A5WEV4_9GAMM|nr:replication protein P [Gammaproteobacteria bacterium]PDH35040.1 MAG: hypothetical protein CNF02_03150 [OM182 bacterium MED-G28]
MQKINPLLDQASKELKRNSSKSLTEAGQSSKSPDLSRDRIAEPDHDYENDRVRDHVDAINQVFAEFEFAYHNQFHKAFAESEALVIAKKYWLSSLERYSPRQIVAAAKKVIQSQEYLPSIAVFTRACDEGTGLFGLPSVRQAYLEACSAPSPKKHYNWSHEAVYYAGKATGWYLLANEPESSALSVFEYHYEQLCRRVVNGEQLTIETPAALSDNIERTLDKEEARARIAKLKKKLGL